MLRNQSSSWKFQKTFISTSQLFTWIVNIRWEFMKQWLQPWTLHFTVHFGKLLHQPQLNNTLDWFDKRYGGCRVRKPSLHQREGKISAVLISVRRRSGDCLVCVVTIATLPCLVIIGQTKAGKSTLINELLQGTFVTQSQTPCTARVTKLSYSDNPHVRVVSRSGEQLSYQTLEGGTQIPEDILVLKDKDRDNKEIVTAQVHAGVTSQFLRSGIDSWTKWKSWIG